MSDFVNNNNNIKISVIIPAYNSSSFIKDRLDYILKQTLKDIEIIVVDDGSTDNTYEILQEIQKNDSRLKLITQENKKQGAARNKGLDIAQGEYIFFVDSDDWIDYDYLEKMYNSVKKFNAECSISSAVRQKPSGKNKYCLKFSQEKYFEGNEKVIQIAKIPPNWQVWGKLYKRNILGDLRFEEEVFYEDPEFLIKLLYRIQNIVTVPEVKYYYFSNAKSTIKSKHSIAKRQDQINSILKVLDFIKKHNIKLEEFTISIERHLFYTIKYFPERIDFYLFGIKLFTKKFNPNTMRNILIFDNKNLSIDGLNLLCINLKKLYPHYKTIAIINKEKFEKYQNKILAHEIIILNNYNLIKMFFEIIKFIKDFKYQKSFCAFILNNNFKNKIATKFLKINHTFCINHANKKVPYEIKCVDLLKNLTHKKLQYRLED